MWKSMEGTDDRSQQGASTRQMSAAIIITANYHHDGVAVTAIRGLTLASSLQSSTRGKWRQPWIWTHTGWRSNADPA